MAERADAFDSMFLAGEVHALITFAQVLALTSQHAAGILSHFEGAEQVALATIEMQPTNDKLVEGFQFAAGQIRKALQRAMGT